MKSFSSILTLILITFTLAVNAAPAPANEDIAARVPQGPKDWRREPSNWAQDFSFERSQDGYDHLRSKYRGSGNEAAEVMLRVVCWSVRKHSFAFVQNTYSFDD